MSTSLDRAEAVRKYFTPTPDKPEEPDYSKSQQKMIGGGIAILIALLLVFASGKWYLVLFGLAAGYFGFIFLKNGFNIYLSQRKSYRRAMKEYDVAYAAAEPKPSDAQIDQWRNEDIEGIFAEALESLDMKWEDVENKDNWLLGGPANLEKTKYRIGNDDKVRFSHAGILAVFLTGHKISAYQCLYEMEYGQTLSYSTKEFPYEEITNLETAVIKEEILLLGQKKDSRVRGILQFGLYTRGVNDIQVRYKFKKSPPREAYISSGGNNNNDSSELIEIGSDKTIKVIRKKLEEYKTKYSR